MIVYVLYRKELCGGVRGRVEEDFARVTALVKEVEGASSEARALLLRDSESEKKYLVDETLKHLSKLKEN